MSIAEITLAEQALSRSEKLQRAKLLIDGLASKDALGFVSDHIFPIHTPQFSSEAAAQ